MSKIQVTLQDYHDLLEKGQVDKTAVYEIRSQDDLNKQGRDSEVLISTIEELERTKKQLDIAVEALKIYGESDNWDYNNKFCPDDIAKYGWRPALKALYKIKELEK